MIRGRAMSVPVVSLRRTRSVQGSVSFVEDAPRMKTLDSDQWVERQFGECELGNLARTKRLQSVAINMLSSPEQSLPKQNVRWADLKAAYRLFGNQRVTFDAVSDVHWRQTRQTAPGRYLCISDTTDIDHSSRRATAGLGMLGDGKGRGMQLHSCLFYDADRQQLVGAGGALVHYRAHSPKNETRMQRLKRVRESQLWGHLVEQVGTPPPGSQWIHVFDRGGDNFEAMCRIRLNHCDWIIRAGKLNRNVLLETGKKTSLAEALQQATLLGSYELQLRTRPGAKARTALLEVAVVQVVFPRPQHRSPWLKQCEIRELAVNVVWVREKNAPKGVAPIEWVLLTSLPITTFPDAYQIIDDYEHRWLIEEYHKVLKTGCAVEEHALRSADRLEPLLGLIAVIGTRLLQLKLAGRNQPEAQAVTHVPSSWLKCLKLARPRLLITGMTVYTFFRELAKLGGFLGRKCDHEPGWQTVWGGYQKIQSLLDALRLVGALNHQKNG